MKVVLISLTKRGERRAGDGMHARQAWKHHAYGCYSRTRWNRGSDIVKAANTCTPALQAPQFVIKVPCLHFWWTCASRSDSTEVYDTVWQVQLKHHPRGFFSALHCGGVMNQKWHKYVVDFLVKYLCFTKPKRKRLDKHCHNDFSLVLLEHTYYLSWFWRFFPSL